MPAQSQGSPQALAWAIPHSPEAAQCKSGALLPGAVYTAGLCPAGALPHPVSCPGTARSGKASARAPGPGEDARRPRPAEAARRQRLRV